MQRAMNLTLKRLESLEDIEPARWNRLAGDDPFLRHEFLLALENTGCIGRGTAWQPSYLVAEATDGQAVGAVPLYVKHDSRGEFVFDFSWADAYEEAGGHYYPKLVAAVPFTPATGQRLLVPSPAGDRGPAGDRSDASDGDAIRARLLEGAIEIERELGASSIHGLFPTEAEGPAFEAAGFLPRKSCQFHWTNRGYADFDEFLGTFNAAKRKKAKRERRRVAEAGIRLEHLAGDELGVEEWDTVFGLHAHTFLCRGRRPYLNRAFFAEIARTMPERIVVITARHSGQTIAAAICFRGNGTLYGRYWGAVADFHSLHFETCYHQGIEYCIREGLERFEPGTQGEHKISRGFSPTATWSWHRLADPRFQRAVEHFLHRETEYVDAYMDYLDEHVPYRKAAGGADAG